ncbi:MAG: serine protease [Dehalococcoidales bacterium]|nr:serine protease [Dehalococcoidales bacterium]
MTATIIVIIVLVVLALAFVIERVVAAHRRQVTTGREELIGKTATTRTPLTPTGQVFFRGERWEAISESGNIEENQTVTIIKVKDLVLYVVKPDNNKTT